MRCTYIVSASVHGTESIARDCSTSWPILISNLKCQLFEPILISNSKCLSLFHFNQRHPYHRDCFVYSCVRSRAPNSHSRGHAHAHIVCSRPLAHAHVHAHHSEQESLAKYEAWVIYLLVGRFTVRGQSEKTLLKKSQWGLSVTVGWPYNWMWGSGAGPGTAAIQQEGSDQQQPISLPPINTVHSSPGAHSSSSLDEWGL